MDNKTMSISNVRLDIILQVLNNIENMNFINSLEKERHRFREEENLIIDNIISNRELVNYYSTATTRDEILKMLEENFIKKTNTVSDWGMDPDMFKSPDYQEESDLDLEDLDIDFDLDDLDADIPDYNLFEDIQEGEDSHIGATVNIKKMPITMNGLTFDLHLIENEENILSIFGKKPHKLAFLWTFPELEPVLNIPALLRLMNTSKVEDCQVSVNYKDPDLIEYRLLKGLLSLNIKDGK